MTEQQIKQLCKWALDNSNRPLTEEEKELLKVAIDQAKNINELLVVAIAVASAN